MHACSGLISGFLGESKMTSNNLNPQTPFGKTDNPHLELNGKTLLAIFGTTPVFYGNLS